MAIRMKTNVLLKASGQAVGHARTDVSVRDLVMTIDEPAARGGTNLGPAPTEVALGALAGCTNVIAHKCADAMGIALRDLRVDIDCDFDRRGVTLSEEINVPFTAIRQNVFVDGDLDDEMLARLAAEVAKFCPLAKLFEQAGTSLTTTWAKAST